MAISFLILRLVLERFWFAPFGLSLGIRNTRTKKAPNNPILEAAYQSSSKIKHKQILSLSKQTDLTERQVERWWRQRRSQDKPSLLVKFCECAWRCFFYSYNFLYGLSILWDKEWLWNIDHCYLGYPHQGVTNDIWWYYMVSLAFYWSLTMSQFFDVRRKDFWQMFVHHIATIALMAFSWVCNLHRTGTLVLLLHDCADVFLEGAKMAKYANYQKICDCVFGLFTILWLVTRMGIYPFYIIWSTLIRAPTLLPMFPAYYIFNSLLVLLLVLHVLWTWLILQIVYNSFAAGQMDGDIRSSSSELSDSSQNSKGQAVSASPAKPVRDNGHDASHRKAQ